MKIAAAVISFVLIFYSPTILSAQEKLPSAIVRTLDGDAVNTATFSNNGKPIIIDFFATWCRPCIMELNAMADRYDYEQKHTGVKVILISVDSASVASGKVAKFVKNKGWRYEVYLDSAGIFQKAMGVTDTPETYIISGDGKIVWKHTEYLEGDEVKLFEAVDKAAGR